MGPSPHLWFLDAKQWNFAQNNKSLCVPDFTCRFVHEKQRDCTRMTSLCGFYPSSVVMCMQSSDFRTRLTSLYGSQTSSVVLSTHHSVLSTRISRLYGFQPSPVVWYMQRSVFRNRNTSLCGSQTQSVVLACKRATSALDWQVSICPRHDLWFCK